jgi:hypothetical protein
VCCVARLLGALMAHLRRRGLGVQISPSLVLACALALLRVSPPLQSNLRATQEFITYFQAHPLNSLIEFHDPTKVVDRHGACCGCARFGSLPPIAVVAGDAVRVFAPQCAHWPVPCPLRVCSPRSG